jgi:hypothetical protein
MILKADSDNLYSTGAQQRLIQTSRQADEQQSFGFGVVKTGHVAHKRVSVSIISSNLESNCRNFKILKVPTLKFYTVN